MLVTKGPLISVPLSAYTKGTFILIAGIPIIMATNCGHIAIVEHVRIATIVTEGKRLP